MCYSAGMREMAKHPWLTTRGSTYYARAPVPVDIAEKYGKREVTYSLRTKDAVDARRLIVIEAKRISDDFETHRQGLVSTPGQPLTTPLDANKLQRLGDEFYQDVVDNDFAWRSDLLAKARADRDGFLRGDYIAHPNTEWFNTFADQMTIEEMLLCSVQAAQKGQLATVERQRALADIADHAAVAVGMAKSLGLTFGEADLRRLARRLLEAEIGARSDILAQDQSKYDAIIAKHGSAAPIATRALDADPTVIDPGPTAGSLIAAFLAEGKIEGLAVKTTMGDATDLREYMDVAGDKPIRLYTKADGVKFKETLLACPAQRKVAPFKGMNIVQAVKKAKDVDASGKTIARLHRDTINDKLMAISKFFVWANGHHGSVPNPLDGLRIKVKKRRGKTSERRHPFNQVELVKLFNGPVYRGCASMRAWKNPGTIVPRESARFWAPLIGLYSGMRMGEIIQLHVADIKTDDQGITYFDITTIREEDDDEADKSLKTGTSQRQIPIHPFLIECGLLGLVQRRRKADTTRLLTDYDQSPTDGSWSKTFSAWFRHYRKHVGVERIIRGKNRVDFHSFRHNFEDVVRDLPDVKQEVRDALQGHGENGVSSGYGSGVYRSRLDEAMKKVRYADLDLAHLLPSANSASTHEPSPFCHDANKPHDPSHQGPTVP